MQLTQFTDYALRTLLYLALKPGETIAIQEISDSFRVSRNHLLKVARQLAQHGYIRTTRGKGGGIRLFRAPDDIVLGDVVRKMEPNMSLLECFSQESDNCLITPVCRLKPIMRLARSAFFDVLDRFTIAEMVTKPADLKSLLQIA